MYKKAKETLMACLEATERVVNDPRTKTTGRKLTKILDNWHMLWDLQKRASGTTDEYCLMSAYYNMITRTMLESFDGLDDMYSFIQHFIYLQLKGVEVMSNED